jgi:hypothetical protein
MLMQIDLFLEGVLPFLAVNLPLYLVWLVGIVLSIITWNKHPKSSLLSVIAFVIFFINTLVSNFLSILPVYLHNTRGMSLSNIGTLSTILNLVLILFRVVGWVLILIAIFGRRKSKAKTKLEAENSAQTTLVDEPE